MSCFLPVVVSMILLVSNGGTISYFNATTGGNSAGAPCVFPFLYKGVYYNNCTSINYSTLWCSTTSNYTRDAKWGECPGYDVCLSHKNLSDPKRNVGLYSMASSSGWLMNDLKLEEGWYEFTGVGGDRMVYFCLNISYPGNNVLKLKGVSNLVTCDAVIGSIQHLDCGGGLVLYYLVPVKTTYITRHSSCDNSSCGELAHCGPLHGSCLCNNMSTDDSEDFYPCSVSVYGIGFQQVGFGILEGYGDLFMPIKDECKASPGFQCTVPCAQDFLNTIETITDRASQQAVKSYLGVMLNCGNVLEAKQTDLVFYGNAVLKAVEKLVSTLVWKTDTQYHTNITLQALEVQIFVIGPNSSLSETLQLNTSSAFMDIDLIGISKNNNGSAAVAFINYANLSRLLGPSLFNSTSNTIKTMMSTVVSATLPKTTNTQLTTPVNFTLKHIAKFKPESFLRCVYWNKTEWVIDGCNVTHTNSSHTTCSCIHLSTFALIMQTEPGQTESDSHLELFNKVAVTVGLCFLSLALLTFALHRRNLGLTKTALMNLCISLLFAHLLFLLTQELIQREYIGLHQLVCAALAGVQHFLFLSAFVWMFIEAVLLFISVKNLTKISSKQEVLGWKCLVVIGYTIPLVIVGVSVGLFRDGYGSEQCWIKSDKNLTWSFLGPVCFILASNVVLFIVIIIMLGRALAGLDTKTSEFRQARIIVFKTLAQVFILGCSWILGFFTEGRKVLEIIFLFLNSQQGTFIFLIHCVLNQEVRQQYRKWLGKICSCSKLAAKKK